MEGATSFGSKDLLGLNVKEEGFDGCGGVSFLVEKKGEVLMSAGVTVPYQS